MYQFIPKSLLEFADDLAFMDTDSAWNFDEEVHRSDYLEQLPEFSLECMYDDWDDPGEVTVFSTDDGDDL